MEMVLCSPLKHQIWILSIYVWKWVICRGIFVLAYAAWSLHGKALCINLWHVEPQEIETKNWEVVSLYTNGVAVTCRPKSFLFMLKLNIHRTYSSPSCIVRGGVRETSAVRFSFFQGSQLFKRNASASATIIILHLAKTRLKSAKTYTTGPFCKKSLKSTCASETT